MNKTLVVAAALAIGLLQSGASADESRKAEGALTFTLLKVTPEPGAIVNRDTIVRATVRYSVEPFPGDQDRDFVLLAQFATPNPNRTIHGTYPDRDFPVLPKHKGEAVIEFPLKAVWDQPDLQRPLTMWLYLGDRFNNGSISVIAKSEPVKYAAE